MKKLICLLLALLLTSSCAFAGGSISSKDVSQPKAKVSGQEDEAPAGLNMADVLSALKGDEITSYEAVEKTAAEEADMSGFNLSLHVLNPENPVYPVLAEIAAFVEEAPVCDYLGEEAVAAAQALQPEGVNPAALVLDELYQLTVSGYDPVFGNIEAAFEFVTEYPQETVLLAAAGLLPAEDAEESAILWLPMQAGMEDGKVCIQLTQQVLEAANIAENTVAFALLRAE